MKSLQELNAIKERMQQQAFNREVADENTVRVVVGMGTCGIAAGAKSVLKAFAEDVCNRNLKHVVVCQNGCVGQCALEPIVEVYLPGTEKVTYGKVTPEMVSKIVAEHIINKKPVKEFTVDEK